MLIVPKRRAPDAKPVAAIGPRASGGAMFLTVDGGGMVATFYLSVFHRDGELSVAMCVWTCSQESLA